MIFTECYFKFPVVLNAEFIDIIDFSLVYQDFKTAYCSCPTNYNKIEVFLNIMLYVIILSVCVLLCHIIVCISQ